jgi:hypothetical protein
MATKVKTDEIKDESKILVSNTQSVPLSETDKAEIEKTFSEAKDFRHL